jgi:mannose-1-phosphate guanylyltransferase / mannose-6-phosphate isomerase
MVVEDLNGAEGENQSTYIPMNTLYRLENSSNDLLEIIEIQSGDYLEEDDITRYDDDYGRE